MRGAVTASLFIAAAAGGCEGFERMIDQPSWRPYDDVPRAEAGAGAPGPAMAMLVPPEGAVPMEAPRLPEPVQTGLGADGEPLADVPIPVTAELLRRGRHRFETVCAACHGVLGDGDTPVAANMTLRRPPSLLALPPESVRPGHLFRVTTLGYGLMPSYRVEIPVEERWAIAGYVQALRLSQRVPIDRLPTDVRERLLSTQEEEANAP